ncbi:MAG: hypothetical protein ACYC6Y_06690 [Thermoguttaceae bacterium]
MHIRRAEPKDRAELAELICVSTNQWYQVHRGVTEIAVLEREVSGLDREKDIRYCIENELGIWETAVHVDGVGHIDGFLASALHPAFQSLGPGTMRGQSQAVALIAAALGRFRGRAVLGVIPTTSTDLVQRLYAWGARNVEIHFGQTHGPFQPYRGVNLPTYVLETG